MKIKFPSKKKLLKHVLFLLAGSIIGFGYFYFIGCRTNTCAITSSPFASILYGSFIGFVLSI